MRGAALITFGSVMLTAFVVGNAYYQKQQFYPSVVYITKSNPSMAVIYLQSLVLVILLGEIMRKVFFGQLRAAEQEHLIDRSWYVVTETCLAFTIFRDDFSPKFVALFTLLLFLKCFHWLADDRVDYMERSPVISAVFHMRVVSLLAVLGTLDLYMVNLAYHSTLTKGASVQLVFGFEYAILVTIVVNIFIKYVLHTVDLQRENPWENKAVFLLYTELAIGFIKVLLYILFMIIMMKILTFPLFAIRPMYLTIRAFKKAFNDVIMSRRAIRNMNTLYPDVTPEELANSDNVCIICREEMTSASKRLPCNHIFHTGCLRSWFQRQQTCPTCRMDVLRMPTVAPATPNVPPPARQLPQQRLPGHPDPPFMAQMQANGQIRGPLAGLQMPPIDWFAAAQMQGLHIPMPPQHAQAPPPPAAAQPQNPGTSATPGAGTSPNDAANRAPKTTTEAPQPGSSTAGSTAAWPNFTSAFPMPPPPPFFTCAFALPPFVAPPMPPSGFAGMTTEELHAMEGVEREHVEARIKCLRNIQTLLDAAVLQMQQYSTLMTTLRCVPRASGPVIPDGASGSQTQSSRADEASGSGRNVDGNENDSLEGAVGYSADSKYHDKDDQESGSDDREQLRRRRIQRFGENAEATG